MVVFSSDDLQASNRTADTRYCSVIKDGNLTDQNPYNFEVFCGRETNDVARAKE